MRFVWLVGKIIEGGWMCEGCFATEELAIKNCPKKHFISKVEINKMLPSHVIDSLKLYFPNEQKWEDSALYKNDEIKFYPEDLRNILENIPKELLERFKSPEHCAKAWAYFCDEVYFSSWIKVNEGYIDSFVDWLLGEGGRIYNWMNK